VQVCDKGQATRHDGKAANPSCTLIMAAEDWASLQRVDLQYSTAYMTGKLKIEGDMTLLQLEDVISKFTKTA
jgi:putative sterol carrier protein